MISKIARRLGFEQSVPVALIDDWLAPASTQRPIELAPREGRASCQVDRFGRIQIAGASWTLDLTLAAGARWVAGAATERTTQKMIAPGLLETTFQTPSGPVTQRIAAGVVGGQPAAIVEVENTGGVAIAVGLAARPLRLDGRGYIGEIAVDAGGIAVEGDHVVRFESAPSAVTSQAGPAGDILAHLPDAGAGSTAATSKCRSGGAQAAAVWPVPHTATVRFVVALAAATSPTAAVPSTDEVRRGWQAHLKQGMRVDVDDVEVGEHLGLATQSVMTLWPERDDAPSAILAIAEAGFGRDAQRFFTDLEKCDDDARVLRSLARWAQLGEQAHQLEPLEAILGRLAQAAHVIASAGGELPGRPWLSDALVALGGRLHQIEQPDVAERVQGFRVASQPVTGAADRLGGLTKQRDKRGVWPDAQLSHAADYVRTVRSLAIDDAGNELGLLPEVPLLWRGRTIDVFGLPVTNGSVSFGLRWHGPRPALLWEAQLAPEIPVQITVPGIDPAFVSTERQGEALLADPGWQTA